MQRSLVVGWGVLLAPKSGSRRRSTLRPVRVPDCPRSTLGARRLRHRRSALAFHLVSGLRPFFAASSRSLHHCLVPCESLCVLGLLPLLIDSYCSLCSASYRSLLLLTAVMLLTLLLLSLLYALLLIASYRSFAAYCSTSFATLVSSYTSHHPLHSLHCQVLLHLLFILHGTTYVPSDPLSTSLCSPVSYRVIVPHVDQQ